jgi:hypothetical protein
MGVHPERDRRIRVPQPVRHDVHRHTRDQQQGVRTLDLSDYPSGALFQRKATDRNRTQADATITELTHDLPTRSQPETSARQARITLVPSIA